MPGERKHHAEEARARVSLSLLHTHTHRNVQKSNQVKCFIRRENQKGEERPFCPSCPHVALLFRPPPSRALSDVRFHDQCVSDSELCEQCQQVNQQRPGTHRLPLCSAGSCRGASEGGKLSSSFFFLLGERQQGMETCAPAKGRAAKKRGERSHPSSDKGRRWPALLAGVTRHAMERRALPWSSFQLPSIRAGGRGAAYNKESLETPPPHHWPMTFAPRRMQSYKVGGTPKWRRRRKRAVRLSKIPSVGKGDERSRHSAPPSAAQTGASFH